MKFKELITELTYDIFEVSEIINVTATGSKATLVPGKQFSIILLETMSGISFKNLINKELSKHPETNVWELSV